MHDVSIAPCNTYHPAELRGALERALGLLDFELPRGVRVLVKPNAVTNNRPEQATATHPAVVDAVCGLLSDVGCDITIGDSSAYWFPGYTRAAFEALGHARVARRHGAAMVCFEELPFRIIERPGFLEAPRLFVADTSAWDLVVNLPKLKVHRTTRISGAVKNLFGLVPGASKARYHELLEGRHDYLDRFGAVIYDVYRAVQPGLNILDAVVGLERDGPAANGDPRRTRFLMASRDALALDVALCGVIGEQVGAVTYLREAMRRGDPDPGAVRLLGQAPSVGFVLLEDMPRPGRVQRRAKRAMFQHLTVRPSVDAARCQRCGACAERCQLDAIGLAPTATIDAGACVWCYACVPACQAGALALRPSRTNRTLQRVRKLTGM
jgi:uncharacterized protein (DUF362 family)/NAD-dependent dihydropyrimidine dehydrogenase PreA subunit